MKKILILFLSLIFTLASHAIVNAPITNTWDNAGTLNHKDIMWIKVKNNTGSALSSGHVVVWDTSADDGATVTTSTTRGLPVACVAMETIAIAGYGKCQVYGYHAGVYVNVANNNATAGYGLIGGPTAGYAEPMDHAASPVYQYVQFATLLDSGSTSTTYEAVIHAL